jgi:LPXTG-site transpeptidase (sortase) family protein
MPPLKILLSWSLIAGGSCFFFSGIHEFWGSRLSQERAAESWETASMREAIERDGEIIPPGSESRRVIPAGEAFARLSIPRLHAVLYVVEGTDSADLHRGPGHLAGSALPGSSGNCVIAGHRDTHFRLLKNVQQGDQIEVETAAGAFTYRVSGLSIVTPGNTASLGPSGQPVLNLITCYPFYYSGPAPQRFVVHAALMASRESSDDFLPTP